MYGDRLVHSMCPHGADANAALMKLYGLHRFNLRAATGFLKDWHEDISEGTVTDNGNHFAHQALPKLKVCALCHAFFCCSKPFSDALFTLFFSSESGTR
jgi:hypothetical protein